MCGSLATDYTDQEHFFILLPGKHVNTHEYVSHTHVEHWSQECCDSMEYTELWRDMTVTSSLQAQNRKPWLRRTLSHTRRCGVITHLTHFQGMKGWEHSGTHSELFGNTIGHTLVIIAMQYLPSHCIPLLVRKWLDWKLVTDISWILLGLKWEDDKQTWTE